ncbi:hypothetical protein FA15DRAFT_674831 [Coprinopsis marcescibilis]|uniref:Uncharacterized protein n=1 Tax=Coprinopsis marcescibilis TaxID=230819 RepID=A0A5C3KFT5_COPMA|nr:hypothetical protein FA15DRAFT_674831 [Coprinopsis marcescibilis]
METVNLERGEDKIGVESALRNFKQDGTRYKYIIFSAHRPPTSQDGKQVGDIFHDLAASYTYVKTSEGWGNPVQGEPDEDVPVYHPQLKNRVLWEGDWKPTGNFTYRAYKKEKKEKARAYTQVPVPANGWVLPLIERWQSGRSAHMPMQLRLGLSILQALSQKEGATLIGPNQPEVSRCIEFYPVERTGPKPDFRQMLSDLVDNKNEEIFFDSITNRKMISADMVNFITHRDYFSYNEPISDDRALTSLLYASDIWPTAKDGIKACGYQYPFKDGEQTEVTQANSTWTLPGTVIHPRMDGYGDRSFIIHYSGIRIWLFWPATSKNLTKAPQVTECTPRSGALTTILIEQMEGLEVMVVGEEGQEVSFCLKANVIYACLSLTESSHIGFFVRHIPFLKEAEGILDWAVDWVRKLDKGAVLPDKIKGEAVKIQGAINAWEALARKGGGGREIDQFLGRCEEFKQKMDTFFDIHSV